MTDVNANDRAIREVTESIDNFVERLTVRQMRNALKKGYRKVAAVSRKTARASLRARGPQVIKGNKRDWAAGIRTEIYSRGGGYTLTEYGRKRGDKGMHRNRRGLLKPVLQWAELGTKDRKTKHGGFFRGKMPAYGFMTAVEDKVIADAERDLCPEVEKAVDEAAAKAGLK